MHTSRGTEVTCIEGHGSHPFIFIPVSGQVQQIQVLSATGLDHAKYYYSIKSPHEDRQEPMVVGIGKEQSNDNPGARSTTNDNRQHEAA